MALEMTQRQYEKLVYKKVMQEDTARYDVVITDKDGIALCFVGKNYDRTRAENHKQMTICKYFSENEVHIVLTGTQKMRQKVEKLPETRT